MPVGICVIRTADSVLLTCWPPAPPERSVSILQIGVVDGDIEVLRLGQHRDRRGRGVDAAGGLGIGHALHAVHAGFEFELGERAAAADLGDDFLEAAHRAFARGHHLDLPALLGGVALVHAEQIAGEQRRLVAAGAGADFENDVALVHRVLGKEREAQLLFERRAPRFELRPFRLGDGAHLGVGRRIVDQAGDARRARAARRDRTSPPPPPARARRIRARASRRSPPAAAVARSRSSAAWRATSALSF